MSRLFWAFSFQPALDGWGCFKFLVDRRCSWPQDSQQLWDVWVCFGFLVGALKLTGLLWVTQSDLRFSDLLWISQNRFGMLGFVASSLAGCKCSGLLRVSQRGFQNFKSLMSFSEELWEASVSPQFSPLNFAMFRSALEVCPRFFRQARSCLGSVD